VAPTLHVGVAKQYEAVLDFLIRHIRTQPIKTSYAFGAPTYNVGVSLELAVDSGTTAAFIERRCSDVEEHCWTSQQWHPTHTKKRNGSSMIIVEQTVAETVKEIVAIAKKTLVETGTHIPTAVLHTIEGMLPIVMPFKNDRQKRALVDYVKEQALERHAYAVTTVTSARIVDSRSGKEEECLVVATSIRGGRPHYMVQRYVRGSDKHVLEFGECTEGDLAATPGQMLIVPPWEDEVSH